MRQRKQQILVSCVSGIAYLFICLNAANWVHWQFTTEFFPYSLIDAPRDEQILFGSMYPGVFMLGALPVYIYLRQKLVSPAFVIVAPFILALWFEAQGSASQADLVTPVGIYLLVWFVFLLIAAFAGSVEWGVKRYRERLNTNDRTSAAE